MRIRAMPLVSADPVFSGTRAFGMSSATRPDVASGAGSVIMDTHSVTVTDPSVEGVAASLDDMEVGCGWISVRSGSPVCSDARVRTGCVSLGTDELLAPCLDVLGESEVVADDQASIVRTLSLHVERLSLGTSVLSTSGKAPTGGARLGVVSLPLRVASV